MEYHYLFGNHKKSILALKKSQELLDVSVGFVYTVDHYFFKALILCAEPKVSLLNRLKAKWISIKFGVWKRKCPENFTCKYLLIEAELARINGRVEKALELYLKAITETKIQGFVHIEALGNELLGKFYLTRQGPLEAKSRLTEARNLYIAWGALAKADHLSKQYPSLFPEFLNPEYSDKSSGSVELGDELDLFSLIETIQTIASERNLKKLQKEILHIVVQVAGGQRGAVILRRENDFFVEAIFELKKANRVSHSVKSIPLSDFNQISKTVVNHVIQYNKECILDDAAESIAFGLDPYIAEKGPKSILCMPLTKQNKLIGVIYLENNVASNAFSEGRIDKLRILSGQMAIALENAQLYEALQKRGITLEKQVEKETTARKRAMLAAQELAKQAQLSTLTLGIAHEIRNPLAAMKGKAGHTKDILTGKIDIGFKIDKAELPFWNGVSKRQLAKCLDGDIPLADQVWQTFIENRYISESGQINDKRFKLFWDDFEIELPSEAEPYRLAISTYMAKTFFYAQTLAALDVFDVESSRVEEICNNMLEYSVSGEGVARTAFSDLVGASDSEKIWEELVRKGYLDENGMIQDLFKPGTVGFTLDLNIKFKHFEDIIIELINRTDKAKKTKIEVNKTLQGISSLFEGNFKKSNIMFYQEFEEGLPEVLGHLGDLRQSIMNIFTNAIYAMISTQKSDLKFYMRTQLAYFEDSDKNRIQAIEIQLEDTGCGIPKSVLPKIMDPFFSTKSVTGGKNIGLGLSIVSQTIQRFGGSIIVESEEGMGTTFKLFLPTV